MGKVTHGYSDHPLYSMFHCMEARCYSKSCDSYSRYGGIGIIICDEWRSDKTLFIKWELSNGWLDGLETDRIDSNKSYYPDNCRFVTRGFNQRNKRIQKNNKTGYKGVIRTPTSFGYEIVSDSVRYTKYGFKNKVDAALARDMRIIKHGIEAPLAFDNIYNNSCNARRVVL